MRWGIVWAAAVTMAEGRYRFFRCTWTSRIRWALVNYPDDGLGISNHGATNTLTEAAIAAYHNRELRKAARE